MALAARPLANTPEATLVIRRRWLVTLLLTVSLPLSPAARASDPIDKAASVGSVTGRAVTDARRPADPPIAVADVDVTLIPYADALVTRLEEIKRRARTDAKAYRTSAEAIAEALRAHQHPGTDGDTRSATTDSEGGFRIDRVSAGSWLLVARRTVLVPRRPEPITKRERETYQANPRITGVQTVTVWVRRITVEVGQTTEVEFTDRNAWMNAVEEQRTLGTGR
jgi:hypothetical protein